MPGAAMAAISVSILLMVTLGIAGQRAGKAALAPAFPWPPWFVHAHPVPMLWSISLWLAELLGGGGLVLALLAVRRGWRPSPRRMVFGSVLAVVALMLIPPVDNGDPLYYAAYGRIAALGHSPYATILCRGCQRPTRSGWRCPSARMTRRRGTARSPPRLRPQHRNSVETLPPVPSSG